MHTKFTEFHAEVSKEVAVTNCSLLYLIYGQNSKIKRVEIPGKITKSVFSGNMYIVSFSLQSFTKFHAAVYEESRLNKQDWWTD